MNILTIILFVIFVLIAFVLIISLFLKQEYAVEREIIINKPIIEVFNYLKILKNQDNFSKWATMDPEMKKFYRGTDGQVGFVSSWESLNKNVGKGEQEILKIIENEIIDYEIRFIKPFKNIAAVYLITDLVTEHHTKVKWGFSSKMKYPMNFMLLFFNMEKFIGKDFEIGLSNLKEILEKN